jgi:hypothetical protein
MTRSDKAATTSQNTGFLKSIADFELPLASISNLGSACYNVTEDCPDSPTITPACYWEKPKPVEATGD